MAAHVDGNFTTFDTHADSLKSWNNQLSLCAIEARGMGLDTRIEAYDNDRWIAGSPWCPASLRLIVINKAGEERRVHSQYDWSLQSRSAEFKRWKER